MSARLPRNRKITNTDGEDKDIIALASDDRDAVVQVFFIRSGKIIGRDHFHVRVGSEESTGDILVNFVKQYYSGTPFIPREIMLQGGDRRHSGTGGMADCKTWAESDDKNSAKRTERKTGGTGCKKCTAGSQSG